ncbi:MAG: pantetheine-phosphate adenylyltransferase [Kiritimatiellae bacterium]|nr:pantetheine-phosphate adenylyltransferase [Kiritimatiellia bacterium]
MRLAIYAGTFDPITLGHVDLVERCAEIFDELILAVVEESAKNTLFSIEERMEIAVDAVKGFTNVKVDSFSGLLIQYARKKDARILIRGLRAYSDFEYEFPMALTNRKLAPEMETLFMMPKEIHSYVSSSTVREVAEFEGETKDFVPELADRRLKEKFAKKG